MKKVILTVMAFSLLLGTSCREETKEESREAIDAVGDDIERGAEEAGEAIEEGVEEVGEELEQAGEDVQEEMSDDN